MYSRAAWSGSRIIFCQVSPEANSIFDFIMALYHSCDGDWQCLADASCLKIDEVEAFLEYSATFLSNLGNYFVSLLFLDLPFGRTNIFVGIWGPKVCACYFQRQGRPASKLRWPSCKSSMGRSQRANVSDATIWIRPSRRVNSECILPWVGRALFPRRYDVYFKYHD